MASINEADYLEMAREIYRKDTSHPKGALASRVLKAIAADMPCPAEPVVDYVDEIDERRELFNGFAATCQENHYDANNAIALSLFLILPLSLLRNETRKCRTDKNYLTAIYFLTNEVSHAAVRMFLAKGAPSLGRSAPTTPTKPPGQAAQASSYSSPLAAPPLTTNPSPPLPPTAAAAVESQKRKAASPLAGTSTKHQRPSSGPAMHAPMPSSGTSDSAQPLPQAPSTPFIGSSPASSASSQSATKRSRKAATAAKERDNNVCVLSGCQYPEAAHIFPFSATKSPHTALKKISQLTGLWGDELSKKWSDVIADASVTESPQNLICLNRHLHALWGAARFGLKPLSSNEGEVVVQFHWLRQGGLRPTDLVPEADDFSIEKLVGSGAPASHVQNPELLAHRRSGIPIETGQIFSIKAQDAELLPSRALLELQWNMVRLAAMSGAADVYKNSSIGDDLFDADGGMASALADDQDVDNFYLDHEAIFEDSSDDGFGLRERHGS